MPSTPMPEHRGRSAGIRTPACPGTARIGGPLVLAFTCLLLIPATAAFPQPEIASLRSRDEMQWGVRGFHAGAFNNAILSLERAVGLDPSNLLARQWLARALYRSGLEEEALAEWRFVSSKGGGGSLLASIIETVAARRSLQRVLQPQDRFALAASIDGADRRSPPVGKPSAVRPRADGTFYVVPYTGTQILRLDPNFQIVQVIRGGLQGFNRPFDIIEGDEGELFVSEYGTDQIARCSASGQKLASFGGSGTAPGRLLGPQYLADDGRGYLYVSEYGNRRVSKFDYQGRFIQTLGSRGPGFAGLEEPAGIAVQGDRLYVADRRAGALQVFDLNGNYMGRIGSFREPEGVFADEGGKLLVAEKGSIVVFDVRDETATPLADPFPRVGRVLGLARDANGDVLAADFDGGKVLLFSRSETLYSGFFVQIERVTADKFPEVVVDVSVTDRSGRPVLGLGRENFTVTEGVPVHGVELPLAATPERPLYVMMLAEKSDAMRAHSAELADAVAELATRLEGSASLGLTSASREAAVLVPAGGRRLALGEAAATDDYSREWRLDQGVRLAASQLVSSRARGAIVYLSTGSLGSNPYGQFSLMELAQYLRNNAISFHVLRIGRDPIDPDLGYLARRTGGSTASFEGPRRAGPLAEAVKAWVPSLYTLRYSSSANADFGRAYIDLQVDVTQQRRTGRDESGYYGPREY
jgi:DNA-binding beta-propeller fold protein YncE